MNWDNPDLPPELLEKCNARIQDFDSKQTELSGVDGAHEAKKLITDLYKICRGSDDTSTEEELLKKGQNWDPDEPEFAHTQKYVNRLFSDRLQEASDYLEKAIVHKESLISEAASNARSKNAKASADKRHAETNQIKENAIAYYVANKEKFINKKDAARKLEELFPPLSHRTYCDAIKGL
jgi:hypothetical protein